MTEYVATLRVSKQAVQFRETEQFPITNLSKATCLRQENDVETTFTYTAKTDRLSSTNYSDLQSLFFDILSIVDLKSNMLETFSLFTTFVAEALEKTSDAITCSETELPIVQDSQIFLFTLNRIEVEVADEVKIGRFAFVQKNHNETVNEYAIRTSDGVFRATLLVLGDKEGLKQRKIFIDVDCGLRLLKIEITESVDLVAHIAQKNVSGFVLAKLLGELALVKELDSAIKQFIVSRQELPDYYRDRLIIQVVDEKGDVYAVYPDGTRKKVDEGDIEE